MDKIVEYNTGNISKYQSGNPLKRYLVKRFDERLMQLLAELDSRIQINTRGGQIRLLDAGCGEGFLSKQIKEHFPDWKVIGLDGAEEAIDLARAFHKGIDFKVGSIYKLPFKDKSFDIVVCSEVLEHLDRPYDALRELKRVTDGALLLTVPHEPWFRLGNLAAFHNVATLGNPIDHVNHWGFNDFEEFAEEVLQGFLCRCMKSFPWSICLALRDS